MCVYMCLQYKRWRQLTIDLLDPSENTYEERGNEETEGWKDYVQHFVENEDSAFVYVKDPSVNTPVFLSRYVRCLFYIW